MQSAGPTGVPHDSSGAGGLCGGTGWQLRYFPFFLTSLHLYFLFFPDSEAEAASEFDGSQAALAVEPAEKIVSGSLPLVRVAFQTAGDEVAVGIAPQVDARHDVIEALHAFVEAAEAVKAEAALAGVDGLAERPGL